MNGNAKPKPSHRRAGKTLRTVLGGALVVVGLPLLVLPGPGLLLIGTGLGLMGWNLVQPRSRESHNASTAVGRHTGGEGPSQ